MTAFAAVCDVKGFAPAARRLGLSPSVVTRLVGRLEARLGVRLLERTTRSVRLTEAGARYLERVKRVLADVEEAAEVARTERAEPRGKLVVAAPVAFGRTHVAPCCALPREVHGSHGGVAARRPQRAPDRGGHRHRRPNRRFAGLDAARPAPRRNATCRRRVARVPRQARQADGSGRSTEPRLDFPGALPRPARMAIRSGRRAPNRGEQRVAVEARFATDSVDAAIDFALDGGGLVRLLLYQVRRHVVNGDLEIVLERYEPPASPIHAVYPSARLMPAKQRAFIDLAVEATDWHFAEATRRRRAKRRASRAGRRPGRGGRD